MRCWRRHQHTRADLLIAGASGKARRSEARQGETTDYLLQHATLPLFLRH